MNTACRTAPAAALWTLALTLWGPAASVAQPQAQAQSGNEEIERGRALYMKNGCYSCHGTVGQGGERSGAPKLAPGTYPFEAFRALVRTPREAMPRFDVQYLDDGQLQLIHRYLSAVPPGRRAADIPELR